MFRLVCYHALIFASLIVAGTVHAADERPERVALLIYDPASRAGTCQLDAMKPALLDLRFVVRTTRDETETDALRQFSALSSTAEAAMVFACNSDRRTTFPSFLNATSLNFLFLLETKPAQHGSAISRPVKTDRDDLMVIHARLKTPENEDVFVRTLSHKLRRPYSLPADILSRTVVSSYYRSRGSMLIELHGRISSGYILAKPPTEKILDAWSRVQKSTDRKALEAFISKFPKTLFADLVRSRLKTLP